MVDVDGAPVVLLAPGGDDGVQEGSAKRMEVTAWSCSSQNSGGARTEKRWRQRDRVVLELDNGCEKIRRGVRDVRQVKEERMRRI